MKTLFYIGLFILIFSSCKNPSDSDILCDIDEQLITIKNASTTFRIDNNFHFEILFKKNNKLYPVTEKNQPDPSIFLTDSLNEKISFIRKTAIQSEINDGYGKGINVQIEALSRNGIIKCIVSLSSYNNYPNVVLVKSTFKNVSELKPTGLIFNYIISLMITYF